MTTNVLSRIETWHENDLPPMLTAPRPGAGSHARDFVDEETGASFRISSTTKSAQSRRDNHEFSPRHRHTFDQFRFYMSGDTNYGPNEIYGEGDCLYIPGGIEYGPMYPRRDVEDDADLRLFYIQFSGSSRIPYYNSNQFADARAKLESRGRFDRGRYLGEDGRNQDGWEALLEETLGRKVQYPTPPLQTYVAVRSNRLQWHALPGMPTIKAKFLGHFTEIGPNAMLVRMPTGTSTPAGQASYQQARCLISGKVRFPKESERVFEPTSIRYIPSNVEYGPTECVDEATVLIVKWAADGGDLFLPDTTA